MSKLSLSGPGFRSAFCWPTLISVVGIFLLISLGTWQLYRMKWKEALLQRIAVVIEQPAQPLENVLEKENKEPDEFRRIIVKGTFDPELHLKWMSRPYKGEVGYHVIVPFYLNSGGTVLVDRGWVPQHIKDFETPLGETTLTLMVRQAHASSVFTPLNRIEKGEIFSIRPKEIAKELGLMTLLPYYGVVVGEKGRTYPLAVPPYLNINNNHFSYALIWYFLALALAVIYVIYSHNLKRYFMGRQRASLT